MEIEYFVQDLKLILNEQGTASYNLPGMIRIENVEFQFSYPPFNKTQQKDLSVRLLNANGINVLNHVQLLPEGRTIFEIGASNDTPDMDYSILELKGTPNDTIYICIIKADRANFLSI